MYTYSMYYVHYVLYSTVYNMYILYVQCHDRVVLLLSVCVCVCVQVKCYIQMSGAMEPNELQDALEVIESTNLKYFTKEMIAEFMALKGSFLAHIGRCVCACVILSVTI